MKLLAASVAVICLGAFAANAQIPGFNPGFSPHFSPDFSHEFLASGLPNRDTAQESRKPDAGPSRPAPTKVNLYVSAASGKDTWTGSLAHPNSTNTDGPLQTLHGARLAVQRVQQEYISNNLKLKQVRVQFEAGTYFLPATESFTDADSGMNGAEIIYENYQTDQPIISGGIAVTGWTKVSETPANGVVTWQASVPHVYFENLYYNNVRLLRPRLTGPATPSAAANLGGYLRIAGQVSVTRSDPTFSSKNCPEPDPSDPSMTKYICNDRFVYDPADPNGTVSSMWQNLTAPASPPTPTCTGNPNSSAPVGDIELVDFEKYEVAKLRINCIDTANEIIYLTGATGYDSNHSTAHGFLPNHRYVIENVKDSLVLPGQWFLDQSTWTVTYLSQGDDPEHNPNNASIIIPQQDQLVVATNLRNVTFKGLTFANDNYTVPAPGYQGSDEIPAAVSFQDSSNITFQGNVVTQTSGVGVDFISCTTQTNSNPEKCAGFSSAVATANNVIKDSAFYDLGAEGLRIAIGGQTNDTLDNIPHDNEVSNNVVAGYGRTFPGSVGIKQGNGHHNTYTQNEVYDGYKGAIHVKFGNGPGPVLTNDNVVSFNLVHDLFQGIMNDAGSIYFGLGNPTAKSTGTGNQMLNNVVHDVNDSSVSFDPGTGYGGDGLYVDDFAGDVTIENNLVYRVSGHAISFSGPRPIGFPPSVVKNNIFAFARLSMVNAYDPYVFAGSPPWPASPQFFTLSDNLFYFDRDDNSKPAFHVQGGCAFAGGQGQVAPYTGFQLWKNNLYFRPQNPISPVVNSFAADPHAFHVQTSEDTNDSTCAGEEANSGFWSYYYFNPALSAHGQMPSWVGLGEDLGSVVKDPGFNHPDFPKDDFSLLNGSPLKGFKVFNPKLAGLSAPSLVPAVPAVPATFQTATLNPATDY